MSAQVHALPSTPFSEEPVAIAQTATSAAPTTVEAKRRRYSSEMYKYTERQAKEARQDVARRTSLSSTDSASSISSATGSAPDA